MSRLGHQGQFWLSRQASDWGIGDSNLFMIRGLHRVTCTAVAVYVWPWGWWMAGVVLWLSTDKQEVVRHIPCLVMDLMALWAPSQMTFWLPLSKDVRKALKCTSGLAMWRSSAMTSPISWVVLWGSIVVKVNAWATNMSSRAVVRSQFLTRALSTNCYSVETSAREKRPRRWTNEVHEHTPLWSFVWDSGHLHKRHLLNRNCF